MAIPRRIWHPERRCQKGDRRILEFLQEFYFENGIPPTVRDIQQACEISSTSVVDYNLKQLEEAGYLNRRREVARGIELLGRDGEPVSSAPRVQIVGSIAAGQPLRSFQQRGPPVKNSTRLRSLLTCRAAMGSYLP